MSPTKPIIKVKFENDSFKVLSILGTSGDQVMAHKVDRDAILQLLEGAVVYKEGSTALTLSIDTLHAIPKHQLHELEFIEDSKLLLFLARNTKMEFSKS